MRCVASSPAAAVQALRTRAGLDEPTRSRRGARGARLRRRRPTRCPDDDVEPPAGERRSGARRPDRAGRAARRPGRRSEAEAAHRPRRASCVADGFNPVVFCRYIATAHYLGAPPRRTSHRTSTVGVVTGELPRTSARSRSTRSARPSGACSSPPTACRRASTSRSTSTPSSTTTCRGTRRATSSARAASTASARTSTVVRATLLYGANNPVDGAVLEVILRKARKIREELGVPVPLPDDGHTLTQALMKACSCAGATAARRQRRSTSCSSRGAAIESRWQDAAEKAKKNRTVFAQRRLKPEEVLPEWHKTLAALGGTEDVRRFVERALARLGSGLEPLGRRGFKAPLGAAAGGRARAARSRGARRHAAHRLRLPAGAAVPARAAQPSAGLGARRDAARAHARRRHGRRRQRRTTRACSGASAAGCPPASPSGPTVALLRLRHQLVTQQAGRRRRRCSSRRPRRSPGRGATAAGRWRAPTRSRSSRRRRW